MLYLTHVSATKWQIIRVLCLVLLRTKKYLSLSCLGIKVVEILLLVLKQSFQNPEFDMAIREDMKYST